MRPGPRNRADPALSNLVLMGGRSRHTLRGWSRWEYAHPWAAGAVGLLVALLCCAAIGALSLGLWALLGPVR